MTYSDITQLIAAMRANGVTRLEWDNLRKDHRLCLTLPDGPPQPPALPPAAPPLQHVRAPAIGHFVARGGEDGLPPLTDTAAVQTGEPLGYIAQGAVLHLLTAPCAGHLASDLPEVGEVFGYGDIVFDLIGEAV